MHDIETLQYLTTHESWATNYTKNLTYFFINLNIFNLQDVSTLL